MRIMLSARPVTWPMCEPFRISRGVMTHVEGIVVTVLDEAGHMGRGEAYGINYEGETTATMLADVDRVRIRLLGNPDRTALLDLLPHGGARCALDCALWDLEAKRSSTPAWRLAAVPDWRSQITAYTLGLRSANELAVAASRRAGYPLLKVKVDSTDPLEAIRIVHAAAPNSGLIVDPNQSWTLEQLKRYAPACRDLGVVLLEQPLAASVDEGLLGYDCPVPICADEIVHDEQDLPRVLGKYSVVNVKLDKSGGLTAGLRLAHAARREGLRLMVGCMAGSSLAMAPAMIIAQLCEFVDLDGPLLQSDDWPNPIQYDNGRMSTPSVALWG